MHIQYCIYCTVYEYAEARVLKKEKIRVFEHQGSRLLQIRVSFCRGADCFKSGFPSAIFPSQKFLIIATDSGSSEVPQAAKNSETEFTVQYRKISVKPEHLPHNQNNICISHLFLKFTDSKPIKLVKGSVSQIVHS